MRRMNYRLLVTAVVALTISLLAIPTVGSAAPRGNLTNSKGKPEVRTTGPCPVNPKHTCTIVTSTDTVTKTITLPHKSSGGVSPDGSVSQGDITVSVQSQLAYDSSANAVSGSIDAGITGTGGDTSYVNLLQTGGDVLTAYNPWDYNNATEHQYIDSQPQAHVLSVAAGPSAQFPNDPSVYWAQSSHAFFDIAGWTSNTSPVQGDVWQNF